MAEAANVPLIDDLRAWIDLLEGRGELVQIQGADWNEEIGALAEMVFQENPRQPAILFDNIKDYPPGYRLLCNPAGTRERLALALRMPIPATNLQFVEQWRQRLKTIRPVPPRVVATGPVLENRHTGGDVDMWRYPAPKWHAEDGGRYIGTGDLVITRDPETGVVNVGTYRVVIHDRNTVGCMIEPTNHGALHLRKYRERGEPCPVAICFGSDPLLFISSCTKSPYCEYDYVGGIRGEPVQVIEGPLTGLPIPAMAEIVIEGEFLSDVMDEGPFGEYHGYYASPRRPEAAVRVQAVYHRNDPIVLGVPPIKPPSDNANINVFLRPALIWNSLEAFGVPDVRGVWPHGGNGNFFVVVAIKQRYPGHARQAALVASQSPAGGFMNRYTVVVDEDIDPTDIHQVIWAMGTRTNPEESIDIIRRCMSAAIDPAMPLGRETAFTSRAIVDACRPFERMGEFARVLEIRPVVREQVHARYPQLFPDGDARRG
jgi:4-hydroxy-3-polyprenylbenzoate decarboxylase